MLHGLVLMGSYFLAFILSYQSVLNGQTDSLIDQTFYIFFGISVLLSFFLLFIGSSFTAILVLTIRCYLIVVQGYALDGFLSYKLVLGAGLIVETCILLTRPCNVIFSALEIVCLLAAQVYISPLGHSSLVDEEVFATFDVIATMGFIFIVLAFTTVSMVNFADSRKAIAKDLFFQKDGMKTLKQFNLDLQSYARTVDMESSERERNRISRELHDISGYIFTNLIALLNAATSTPFDDTDRLSDIITTARLQAQEGLKETRIALRKIREADLTEKEGIRTLNKIILIFQKVTGIEVNVSWCNIPFTFTREINFTLYRTVQEALTNAVRHGMAGKISIHFWIDSDNLKMTISDNGRGSDHIVKGMGLTGMEERIGNLGGAVNVSNNPEGGFSVYVEIPLSRHLHSKTV